MPTCLALLTLITSCGEGVCEYGPAIQKGFDFLVGDFHNEDGSFGRNPALVMPHTIYAVLFLKAAKKTNALWAHLNPHRISSFLDKGTQWLLENADRARQVTEETFRIDPDKGPGNYRFRYMTDALLVQALKETGRAEEVEPIMEAMAGSIDARKAPGGGFYGDRVSTWATAKVLSGLRVAAMLPPARRKRKKNRDIALGAMGIIVLMLAATVYLALVDKLSLTVLLFFVLFVISTMLLANKITGGDFKVILTELLHVGSGKQASAKEG
jgi:hypothetical protein